MIPISIFAQLPQKKQQMLNIGLIGNTEILEPFVKRLRENKNINETPRHQGMRKKLVEGLKIKGIRNEKVLEAIGKVPRHLFMDSSLGVF